MKFDRFEWKQGPCGRWFVWDRAWSEGSPEAQCVGQGATKHIAINDLFDQLAALPKDDICVIYEQEPAF
jgi:hypothetical protein